MRWRPLRSVRSRILASMLLGAAIGMAVAGGTAYLVQRDRISSGVDVRLAGIVEEIQTIAADASVDNVDDALVVMVQRLRPGTNETTFALTSVGKALVPGGETGFPLQADAVFVARILSETTEKGAVRGSTQTTDRVVRYVAIPITYGTTESRGVFVLAVDMDSTLAPVSDAFRTFAIVALVSLLVVGLVGWFVSGRLLRPIRELREAATRITGSDVSERIPVRGSDDVSDLAETVNDMLDRLDNALTSQRQLLDDVGHELKTPITIVRGHLELLNPQSADEVRATTALAIDELDRMNSLVRDIEELAQLGHGLQLKVEPTDISDLIDRVLVKVRALSPTCSWSRRPSEAFVAQIDPERITQALLQLCANAVAHGGASAIEIASSANDERIQFSVRDDGIGIAAEAQLAIFERFRRGEVGRGAAGSGLGLAIVRAIAQAHGGVVSVESTPGTGATFIIDLPLSRVSAEMELK